MISIRPSAYIMAAILVLLLPADWLLAAVLAAGFHEAAHLAAIYYTGGRIESITVGSSGTQIHTRIRNSRKEFVCAAAGPLASILLMIFCHTFPKIAICGVIQAVFNLLPVYPMDGGRMLKCLVQSRLPKKADKICKATEQLILVLFLVFSLIAALRFRGGLMPVFCCVTVFSRLQSAKTPCKSGETAIQ